jgi:hypothetical protein
MCVRARERERERERASEREEGREGGKERELLKEFKEFSYCAVIAS